MCFKPLPSFFKNTLENQMPWFVSSLYLSPKGSAFKPAQFMLDIKYIAPKLKLNTVFVIFTELLEE
jgi:hypothetical protein